MEGLALSIWSPLNSGSSGVGSGWPSTAWLGPGDVRGAVALTRQRNEVQAAGLADQPTDGLGIRDARELDDDAVAALGLDDRLGHAGRVDAPLDDVADRREVTDSGRPPVLGQRLVLDPEPALQVQPELGLEESRAARRIADRRDPKTGEEDDDEREHANDDDENGGSAAHRAAS